MRAKAIYLLLVYHALMRFLTDYFDSDNLYFFMDAVLIGTVGFVLFYISDKRIVSKLSLVLIVALAASQMINIFYTSIQYDRYINYLPYFTGVVTLLEIYRFIDRKFNEIIEDETE